MNVGNCMKHVEIIDDPNDPRLEKCGYSRDVHCRQAGEIIVDSEKVVLRLLESGLHVRSILAPSIFYEEYWSVISKHSNAQLFSAKARIADQVAGYRLHKGIMAVAKRPLSVPVEDLGDRIVVLDGIKHAENVGAIVRNCHAFGVDTLLVDNFTCNPWIRRAIRVSMGSIFKMKIHFTDDLVNSIKNLKNMGYGIYCSSNSPGNIPLADVSFTKRSALVIGCEGEGIRQEILSLGDTSIRIPVSDSIDSLNAAAASAVMLYHMSLG